MTRIVRLVMCLEALTFLIGSILHLGVPILGLHEPSILPATMVEALCGAALLIGAVLAERRTALVAHAIAIAGVLLGIAALAAGRGPTTTLNFVYHRTILVALL